MTGWFTGAGTVLAALASGDSWAITQAMREPAVWPLGLIALLGFAVILVAIYAVVPWVERNLESTVMVVSYLAIGGIIAVEVFRRFVEAQREGRVA